MVDPGPREPLPVRPSRPDLPAPKASAFPVLTCELALPAGAARAAVGGSALPLPKSSPRRIVVIGDSGCAVNASYGVFQACNDAAAWPFAEDWEMWVRLAAHVPVWYETQPLARYRVHAASMTNDYLRTAENARQLRLIMAANERYFPPATARRITRRAIRINALTAVRRARRFLDHGDRAGMWAQLREAVTSDPSPVVVGPAVAVVARLLLRPPMRRIRAWRRA